MRHLATIVVGVLCMTGWQRLQGQYLWWHEGVLVSPVSDSNASFSITEDGTGGMFVGWVDTRGGSAEVYVQRIDSAGNRLWGDAGRAVRTDTGVHSLPRLIPDGQGGAIVLWNDFRISNHCQVFGQRFSAAGNPVWESLGAAITTSGFVVGVTRPKRGTFIEAHGYNGINLQRVDLDGNVPSPEGWSLDNGSGWSVGFQTIVSDSGQGAYVAWDRFMQNTRYYDVIMYWSHVDYNGGRLFTMSPAVWNGVLGTWPEPLLCLAPSESGHVALLTRDNPFTGEFTGQLFSDSTPLWSVAGIWGGQLIRDGTGGFVASGGSRVQRFNESGKLWGDSGIVVDDSVNSAAISGDDSGGVMVCYSHGAGRQVRVKRISASGESAWCAPISLVGNPVRNYQIINDSAGGSIAVWAERRNGAWALYAQRLDIHGIGGIAQSPPARPRAGLGSRLVSADPNPLRGSCRIRCHLRPTRKPATLGIYSVSGSRVHSFCFPSESSGYVDVHWNGAAESGSVAPPGAYFLRLDEEPASPVIKVVMAK